MSSKRTLSAVLAMAGLAVILGATQGCSPGNEPAQSAPGVHAPSKLGNLAPFRTISEDVAAKVDAQDLAGAKPLLIITARPGLDDRLRGLDGGADDFLQKPFEMAELLARMRAVMRRKGGRAAPELGNGSLSLDPASKCARVLEQEPVQLSNREFALLQALLLRPGAILSRGELEDRLYGWGNEVESNAVEFLIHALRRKLGKDVIRNVRGLGWMVSKGD